MCCDQDDSEHNIVNLQFRDILEKYKVSITRNFHTFSKQA